jgi:hypothetical protein
MNALDMTRVLPSNHWPKIFFYFYKKDGKIGFFFDGQHIQTDFTAIPHYACCSGAANNPFHYQNMISFFAGKGEENLYVEIGVYPSH